MANKKPWCEEGMCRPTVPMHKKGCQRRADYLAVVQEVDTFLAEPSTGVHRELPAKDACRSADNYHIPGCRSVSARKQIKQPEDLTQAELDDIHEAMVQGALILVPEEIDFAEKLLASQRQYVLRSRAPWWKFWRRRG